MDDSENKQYDLFFTTPDNYINFEFCSTFKPAVIKTKLKVERIIFNNQATILFWDDGEKTVVKCRECQMMDCIYNLPKDTPIDLSYSAKKCHCHRTYDKEKAIMAAMLKRLYPNYQDVLRNFL